MRAEKKTSQDSEETGQNLGLSDVISRYLRRYFHAHQHHAFGSNLYHHVLEEVERALFAETLRAVDGNQIKAAEVLGIHRNTLRRKMKK